MTKTILAIGAHPDDIEIGCGGTLALLTQQGYKLINLVMTSGEEGSLSTDKQATAQKREQEAVTAAKILGSSQTLFFHEPDGLTSFSKETKIRLIKLIREVKPDIVFTHARSDHFPDHKVICRLTEEAVFAAGSTIYPEAGDAPHEVKSVYGYEVWHPISQYQLSVDITATIEKKIEALRIHASQVSAIDFVSAVRGLAMYRGVMTLKSQYAEVFEALKVSELQ